MGHKHPEETEESNTWQGGEGGRGTTGKGKEEETVKITEEEGLWACKAKAPRDMEGTTSEISASHQQKPVTWSRS